MGEMCYEIITFSLPSGNERPHLSKLLYVIKLQPSKYVYIGVPTGLTMERQPGPRSHQFTP